MRILLVDNDLTYLTLLAEVLTHNSYTVVTAPDGEAAFNLLRKEPFDLVISDVSMPKMNGMNLHRYMRDDAKLRKIPFVWNSGYRELRDVLEIEDPNLDFVLDKVTSIPNLLYFLNHLDLVRKKTLRDQRKLA